MKTKILQRVKENIILKIILMLSFLSISYIIHKCLKYNFQSDIAALLLLGREQINTHQLFPEGFCYSTGIFVNSLNLFITPLMFFFKDWLFCRKMASILQLLLGFLMMYLVLDGVEGDKKNKRSAWYIVCILLVIPLSFPVNAYYFFEAIYFSFAVQMMFLLLALRIVYRQKRLRNTIITGAVYFLVAILINLESLRNVLTVSIPLFLAFVVYIFLESKFDLKKAIQYKREIVFGFLTLVGGMCGAVIFMKIGNMVQLRSTESGASFASLPEVADNLSNFFANTSILYGVAGKCELLSLMGVGRAMSLVYCIVAVIVCPVYMICNYKKIKDAFSRLLVLYLLISNISIVYMAIFTTASSARFLLPCYFNNLLFLAIAFAKILPQITKIYRYIGILVLAVYVLTIHISYIKDYDFTVPTKEEKIVGFLQANNLDYGFATFWNAYNNMAVSNGEITIAAFEGDPSNPFYWLTSKKWYDPEYHKGTSFILLGEQDKIRKVYYDLASKVLHMEDYTILVYDQNILSYKEIRTPEIEITDCTEPFNIAMASIYASDNAYIYDNLYLLEGGLQYGPYLNLEKGIYTVTLEGENLEKAQTKITADNGQVTLDSIIVLDENTRRTVSFIVNDELGTNIEIINQNPGKEKIAVSRMTIQRAQ